MTFPGDLSGNNVKSCQVQFNKGVENLQNFLISAILEITVGGALRENQRV